MFYIIALKLCRQGTDRNFLAFIHHSTLRINHNSDAWVFLPTENIPFLHTHFIEVQ